MKVSDTFTVDGETKTLKEWAEVKGIEIKTLLMRMLRGKPIEAALNTPVKKKATYKKIGNIEIKVKKTDTEKRMTDKELEMFMRCFTSENFGKFNVRNRAICQFLLNTGLRLAEFTQLKVSDVLNLDGTFKDILDVRAETAKRQKNRQVPLNKNAKEALCNLVDKQKAVYYGPLISISSRQVREIVVQASIRSGLNRILSPHCLRHQFLSKVYENTKNLKVVQTLAGHSSSVTTADIYLHTNWNELDAAVSSIC